MPVPMWAMPIARTTKVHAVFLAGEDPQRHRLVDRRPPTTRHKVPPRRRGNRGGDDQPSWRGDGFATRRKSWRRVGNVRYSACSPRYEAEIRERGEGLPNKAPIGMLCRLFQRAFW
jgi:hypothetical protein